MKTNEVYVTDRGAFIGVKTVTGASAWVEVVSQRDGKVNVQRKEVIVVDSDIPIISDVISHLRTSLRRATEQEIEELRALLNVKAAVREDKAATARKDTLTSKDASGPRRI